MYWAVLKGVFGKDKGYIVKIIFFYWKNVLRGGLNKRIWGGIYQYLVKLGLFFNIP
jgi:hypothetical protein